MCGFMYVCARHVCNNGDICAGFEGGRCFCLSVLLFISITGFCCLVLCSVLYAFDCRIVEVGNDFACGN